MDAGSGIKPGPIGVFDSGYGGLTILKEIRRSLPTYSFLYLGDNARAPYGSRSFDIVYDFTRSAVEYLFSQGCHLVILACNTASAKALRTIQQNDLPRIDSSRRVLGVIRPTVEVLDSISANGHIGILATPGTVQSHSYTLEIAKISPEMHVTELACPMWVPLIENHEADNPGADYFVEKYTRQILDADPHIDTLVLACTHYPLLLKKIRAAVPPEIAILTQGELVGQSLTDYLKRHPEIDRRCSRQGKTEYLTTESAEKFDALGTLFMNETVASRRITL